MRLAFVGERDEVGMPRSYESLTSPIFSCAPDGSDLVLLGGTGLACMRPKWTADGEQVAFLAEELGESGRDFVARNMGLYVVPAGNARAVEMVADNAAGKVAQPSGRDDASVGSGAGAGPVRLTDAETIDLAEVGTHLSVSERGVLVQDQRRGTVGVLEIDPPGDPVDAGSATEVGAGNAWHTGHAVTPAGDTVVASMVGPDAPSELVLIRGGPGPAEALPRRLTDLSRLLRDVTPPRPILEREISGHDSYPVHGWAGEGHELSRSGSLTHRRDRFTHILGWWAEYLSA